jgi:hypothetical protein
MISYFSLPLVSSSHDASLCYENKKNRANELARLKFREESPPGETHKMGWANPSMVRERLQAIAASAANRLNSLDISVTVAD